VQSPVYRKIDAPIHFQLFVFDQLGVTEQGHGATGMQKDDVLITAKVAAPQHIQQHREGFARVGRV